MPRLATIFDEAPFLYDRYRPGYPANAIDWLVATAGSEPGAEVLEVGAGTGQLTIPLLERGLRVIALEPGHRMAALLAQKVEPYADVRILVTTFEAGELPTAAFDLVVSATAFHWVDPNMRYALAARALRAAGRLALIRNDHVLSDAGAMYYRAAKDVYLRLAPDLGPPFMPPRPRMLRRLAPDVEASPEFRVVAERRFGWDRWMTADKLIGLLRTYSQHRALAPAKRRMLFRALRTLVDRDLGGGFLDRVMTTVCVAELALPA